ncbi:MAG: AMP-binding protein, partial [Pseudomonadales bacterium]|nr:AMP-binding protein [Pseudomonadales bacterium]
MPNTIIEYLDHWAEKNPKDIWLRAPQGEAMDEWSWQQAAEQIHALAAWQEKNLSGPGAIAGIVSRNRPHWFFADLGSIAAGNVTVPMFTTLQREIAAYEMDFTGMQLLFVGETDNWDQIEPVLPEGIQLIALPGVELPCEHLRWEDIVTPHIGQRASYEGKPDDLITIVFTSGTTGMPKGVMQTHESNIIPIERFSDAFETPKDSRFISYLPLSHIAERQIVEYSSIVHRGNVYFNENLKTLARDLQATRPMMMFGPPRVWEQLQQSVIAQFGSPEAFNAALEQDKEGIGALIRDKLGLDDAYYL